MSIIIKPVKVNEFEFITRNEKGKEYKEDSAKVTVKINNAVKEMKWDEKYSVMSEDTDKYEIEGKFVDSKYYEILDELEIELDLIDLKNEYKELLKTKKIEDEKRAQNENKYNYDHCWVHNFVKEVENLNIEGIKIEKEKYNSENPRYNAKYYEVTISYKGYEITVEKHCTSYGRYYNYRNETKDTGYSFKHSTLTNYKTKVFKKIDNMVNKIKELVDDQIEQETIKKEKKTILKNILGVEIEEKEGYRSSSYTSRSGYYYKYLVANITNEIKINVDVVKEKEEYNRIVLTGIGTFTFEKARKIIDVIKE